MAKYPSLAPLHDWTSGIRARSESGCAAAGSVAIMSVAFGKQFHVPLNPLLDANSGGDDQLGLSNALALADRIAHPGKMLAGTHLRPGSEVVTGTGGAVPLARGR